MTTRLTAVTSAARTRAPASDALSVRTWWNTCLRPSTSPPSCACHRSRSLHNRPQYTPLHRSVFLLRHSSPCLPTFASSRQFSSPSLASAFSSSSTPPPVLPPSPSSSSSLPPLSDSIQLTDAAARRIAQLRSKHGPSIHLRLSVDSGGCSGLSYNFEIDRSPPPPDDHEFTQGEGSVVVDGVSLEMLRGSVVDYTVSIERSGFEVVKNPNSVARCGCGTSFQPKEF